jgi:hypothetical protein
LRIRTGADFGSIRIIDYKYEGVKNWHDVGLKREELSTDTDVEHKCESVEN